jgi:hypothetical protein
MKEGNTFTRWSAESYISCTQWSSKIFKRSPAIPSPTSQMASETDMTLPPNTSFQFFDTHSRLGSASSGTLSPPILHNSSPLLSPSHTLTRLPTLPLPVRIHTRSTLQTKSFPPMARDLTPKLDHVVRLRRTAGSSYENSHISRSSSDSITILYIPSQPSSNSAITSLDCHL